MRGPRRQLGRAVKWGLGGVLALLAYLAVLHLGGNFHTVLAGELYRSAQVTPERLTSYAQTHGVRSVLNLRGAAPGRDWYDAEVTAAAELGLTHADFRMSANEELNEAQAAQLIALMRDLPKPLLIHCRQGSDRTGLAVGLYLVGLKDATDDEGEAALSIRYGHFAVPYLSQAYPMDTAWEKLEPFLGIDDDEEEWFWL